MSLAKRILDRVSTPEWVIAFATGFAMGIAFWMTLELLWGRAWV